MRFKFYYLLFIAISCSFLACNQPAAPSVDYSGTRPSTREATVSDRKASKPDRKASIPDRQASIPNRDSVKPSRPSSQPRVLSTATLKNYGFKIRGDQSIGDQVPPQLGDDFEGQKVAYKFGTDLPWSAFTLVLVRDENGSYRLMTQKRLDGTIETAGGHLKSHYSWRQGAKDELLQEAGIDVNPKSLIFQQGARPAISRRTGLPWGNTNFFVVFDKKPATNASNDEIDQNYGHQWLDLKAAFREIQAEQNERGGNSGKYYHFFRSHVINFCTYVINCEDL